MNELHTSASVDDSGVYAATPLSRAQRFVARWGVLQPSAAEAPEATRQLQREVARLLESCMHRLIALECDDLAPRTETECDELLEASYVLERLEWCVLHNVPYIERPRTALTG